MNTNFHQSYTEGEVKPPSERATGLTFAGVFLLVALLFFRDSTDGLIVCLSAAVVFAVLALGAPKALGRVNQLWFRFSLLLHRIVNPVVMGLVFLLAFVPFGALMRLRSDPLRRHRAEGPTYWVKRKPGDEVSSMSNQF